jgi:hypothetical protein
MSQARAVIWNVRMRWCCPPSLFSELRLRVIDIDGIGDQLSFHDSLYFYRLRPIIQMPHSTIIY